MTDYFTDLPKNWQKIIDFTCLMVFSTPAVFQDLLGQGSIQATHQQLKRLEKAGLLRRASIPIIVGRSITLYGITQRGLTYCSLDIVKTHSLKTFQPSKVSISTLQHRLDLQQIYLITKRAGWSNWLEGSSLGVRAKNEKIVDAIATDNFGTRVAIEVERECKSTRRYRDTIVSHLIGRKYGKWERIIYLCPNQRLTSHLEYKFKQIKSVNFNNKAIVLTPQHFDFFSFFSYDNFAKHVAQKRRN